MAIIKEFFKWLFYMKSFIFYISMFGFQKIFHRRNVLYTYVTYFNINFDLQSQHEEYDFFFNFWQELIFGKY